MNSPSQYKSYATNQRGEEDVRETEARALLSCASRLDKVIKNQVAMDDYVQAIKHNLQLWAIFQSCLCEKDNPLSRELKTLILNLSIYVNDVSLQALTAYQPELLESIININRTLAAGLSVKPPAANDSRSPSGTVAASA